MPLRRINQPQITQFMDSGMTKERQRGIDLQLIKFMTCSNISFTAIESPYFKQMCSLLHKQYKVPSAFQASNALLNGLYADHMESLNTRLREQKYVSLATDSWKDSSQNTIVNVVACIRKPILLSSVIIKESLTADVYKKELVRVMASFGLEGKVVQIITDGGSNAVKARDELAGTYPMINSSYCVSHQLNLLIGDLLKTKQFNQQIKLLVKILYKIKYNSQFRTQCQRIASNEDVVFTAVILPSPTRWEYYVRVVDGALKKKVVLKYLAAGDLIPIEMTDDETEIRKLMGTEAFWSQLTVVSIKHLID